MVLSESLFRMAEHGAEAILWFLLVISVISVAVMLERWWTLRQIRATSQKMRNRLQDVLATNSLGDLEELGKDKESIEGRALNYGLRHSKQNGASGLEQIFNSFTLFERPHLEKSLSFLATVGSNAPFVGLLGTVLGIMKAFRDLAENPTAGNEAVMAGIAEALVATAVGLLVAIPAVIAFNFFQRQVRSILQSLDTVKELCLAFTQQNPQSKKEE